jgi:hypothetical protein
VDGLPHFNPDLKEWYLGMQLARPFHAAVLVTTALLLSCDGSGTRYGPDPDPPVFETEQTEFTDQELWDAVYSEYKYPPSFYSEEHEDASPYYVNTISIKPLHERGGAWIELCTNQYPEARNWADSSDESSSVRRTILEESQSEKYFEFLACNPQSSTDCIRFRVHKCGYLDRGQYDRFVQGALLGTFNQRPINQVEVRELVEYLFFLESYNTSGSEALSSLSSSNDSAFVQTIYAIEFSYGDYNLYDRITLYRSTTSVNRTTGEVRQSRESLRSINGRYHPGT